MRGKGKEGKAEREGSWEILGAGGGTRGCGATGRSKPYHAEGDLIWEERAVCLPAR